MNITWNIKEIKQFLKERTDKELLEFEIMGGRLVRPPFAFGLEVSKFYRRLLRQLVKEQISRKLTAWSAE
jgi:hypothetical protein